MPRSDATTDGAVPLRSYERSSAANALGFLLGVLPLILSWTAFRLALEPLDLNRWVALLVAIIPAVIVWLAISAAIVRWRYPRPAIDVRAGTLVLGGRRIAFADVTRAWFRVDARSHRPILLLLGASRGPRAVLPLQDQNGPALDPADAAFLIELLERSSVPTSEDLPPAPRAMIAENRLWPIDRDFALDLCREPQSALAHIKLRHHGRFR